MPGRAVYNATGMSYSIVNVEELEPAGPGGAVRFVRRELGLLGFGEDVAVRHGTVIRFDPETTRQAVAGPNGMTFVSVGARRGSYEPRGPF